MEHQFILDFRPGGPTFVALTLAFMNALNKAQLSWYYVQARLLATLQALPNDPFQWPNVVLTPYGTLEAVNMDMHVDLLA